MKKINIILCAVAIGFMGMLSGCGKDEPANSSNALLLSVDDYSHNGKAYISGNVINWSAGDSIRLLVGDGGAVNCYDAAVSITYPEGVPVAVAQVADNVPTFATGTYVYGAYPGRAFSSATNPKSIIVTLPDTYTYETDFGNQVIKTPMLGCVEKTEGEDVLYFKSVCALLKLHLNTIAAKSMFVDKVKVEAFASDGTTPVQISGNKSIDDLNKDGNNKPTFSVSNSAWTSGSYANNSITLNIGKGAFAINNNHSQDVYIPVPPLPVGTKLKISIHNQRAEAEVWVAADSSSANLVISCPADIQNHAIVTLPNITIDGTPEFEIFDYLENRRADSTINLGVSPTNTSKLEITYSVKNSGGAHRICGSSHGTGGSKIFTFAVTGGESTDNWGLTFAGNTKPIVHARKNGHKNYIKAEVLSDGNNSYYADFTYMDLTSNTIITASTTPVLNGVSGTEDDIYIFGTATDKEPAEMKLYSFNLSNAGSFTHNFVPAIHHTQDGTNKHYIGLYNTVTKYFIEVEEVTADKTVGTWFKVGDD